MPNRFKQWVEGNPLYFVFLLPLFMDSLLTLLGQGAAYWQNPQQANEMSPTYFILALGPIAHILFALIWAAFLYFIMQRLKDPLNLMLALGVLLYHTHGSSAWLSLEIKRWLQSSLEHRLFLLTSWFLVAIYFVVVGVCAAYALRIYMQTRPMSSGTQQSRAN